MTRGRWPANLIHDGSAEATEEFPYTKSGSTPVNPDREGLFTKESIFRPGQGAYQKQGQLYGDEGSASRFFKATPYDNDEDDFVFNEKVKIEMTKTESLDLRHGDCLDVLRTIADNSIDSIVTDPPYGLSDRKGGPGFMGKKWDSDVPSIEIWTECYRVLKPGGYLLSFGGTRTYHRLVVNVEDAGFEIRDMVNWVYGCYSEDTECLTTRGWLKYHQLKIGDRILQWNHLTDELSWYSISETLVYDAPENMVSIKNRHTDQLLTQNHTVYAKLQTHSRNPVPQSYSAIEADALKPSWHKTFPVAGKLVDGVQVDKAYIIGWWLTDAWVHADGKACMFSQSKYLTLSKLRTCLEQSNCSFSEYEKESNNPNHKNEHTFYVTGSLANYLLERFPTRDLSWDMLSWDWNSRLSLVEGLLDGDGSRRQTQHSETFWSLKHDRLDIFQALCVSLNIRSHIDYKKGCVYLNRKTNTTQLQKRHVLETIKYDGQKVWCLQTETGAFVVRRNGRPFISGNSGFPKSLNVGKAIYQLLGAERQVISKTGQRCGVFAHSGGGKEQNIEDYEAVITAPASDEAKQWEGWGTALKPAHEPICVARKPLSEKSVAENVLTWGAGAINIDESRVELLSSDTKQATAGRRVVSENKEGWGIGLSDSTYEKGTGAIYTREGRWPANLIHDGSAEATEEFPNTKYVPGNLHSVKQNKGGVFAGGQIGTENIYKDSGSSARFFKATPYDNDDTLEGASFFYCAKASTSERDEGMTGEAKPVVTFATANGTSGKPPVFTVGRNRIEYVTNDSLSEDLLKEIQEALDGQARP